MNKLQIKTHIKTKVEQVVLSDLKRIQMSHSKIKDIKYTQFKIQPYLKSQDIKEEMKSLLFTLRSCMARNFKFNFSSIYKPNLRCQLNCEDPNALDSHTCFIAKSWQSFYAVMKL